MANGVQPLLADVKEFGLKLKSHFDRAVSGGNGYGVKLAARGAAAVVATLLIAQTGMYLPLAAVAGAGLSLWYGVRTERRLTGAIQPAAEETKNRAFTLHDKAARAIDSYQTKPRGTENPFKPR